MKVSPADRPKVAALLVLIVLIGGYGVINFMGRKTPAPATVPGQAPADPNANLPNAADLANGKIHTDSDSLPSENLNEVFKGSDPALVASIDPFRSPVPRPKVQSEHVAEKPYTPPAIGGNFEGPLKPMPVNGATVGLPETSVESANPMLVKGIIASQEGESDGMVFIQIGEVSKGYRVGDSVAPGMKIVSITTNAVTLRVAKREISALVGQTIKPF